jgi:hypothetical protein
MRFDFLNVLNGAKRLNCLNGLNPTVDMFARGIVFP